jgi:hypothetical protein
LHLGRRTRVRRFRRLIPGPRLRENQARSPPSKPARLKVYADAFQEVKGYERIPGAAMIARMEVHKQARGLNLPIEPPRV